MIKPYKLAVELTAPGVKSPGDLFVKACTGFSLVGEKFARGKI